MKNDTSQRKSSDMSESFINTFHLEDNSVCDDLIGYFKDNHEYKNPGLIGTGFNEKAKKSTDVIVGVVSNHPAVKKLVQLLLPRFDEYVKKYRMPQLGLDENFLIQHYKPGENYAAWHYERDTVRYSTRALAFMVYLNDVHEGGETLWYWQKNSLTPEKGLGVIWPADFTHAHAGVPAPSEDKYIVTGWLSLVA